MARLTLQYGRKGSGTASERQVSGPKKWPGYRKREILGRSLTSHEMRTVTEIARRIAAILLLEPELDANYAAARGTPYRWSSALLRLTVKEANNV